MGVGNKQGLPMHGRDHRLGGADPVPLGLVIEDEGVDLPERSIIDFVGSGVTATDDGVSKTIVTIPGLATEYALYDSTGVFDVGPGVFGEVFFWTWGAPTVATGAFTYSGANDELAVFSGGIGSVYSVCLNVQFSTPVNAKRFEFAGDTVQGTRGHPGSWSGIPDAHAAFTYDSRNHGTYAIGTYHSTWQNVREFVGTVGPDFASGFGYEEDHTSDPITSGASLLIMRVA